MKKFAFSLVLLVASGTAVMAQQTMTNGYQFNNQAPNPTTVGIGTMIGTIPSATPMATTPSPLPNQNPQIKTLEQRRQDQIAKQQADLAKSGLIIKSIPPQNTGVMMINPNQMQNPQQRTPVPVSPNNNYMNGLQGNGAPMVNGAPVQNTMQNTMQPMQNNLQQ